MGKLELFAKFSTFQYVAQILTITSAILYSFIAANYLGPEKYGLIYYLMGFIAGIPMIFGFEMFYDSLKVYLARYRSFSFFKKMLIISTASLAILMILTIVFSSIVVAITGKGTNDMVILFSVLIFVIPLYSIFESILMGFKNFGKILILVIIEKIAELALLVFFLYALNLDYLSLFYATLFSTITVLVFGAFFIKKLKFSSEKIPIIEIKKFVSQSWIMNVAKGFVSQSELWIFGLLLSLGDFGILYLIKKLTIYLFEAPQIALSEVVMPFLSEEKNIKKIVDYTSKVVKFQFLLSIVIAVFSIIAVPFVIPLLFPKFVLGIELFPLLVVGQVLYFGIPLTRLLKVTNNNNLLTILNAFYVVLIVSLGVVFVNFFGIIGAAIAISVSRIISGISLYVLCRYKGYPVQIIPKYSDLAFFFDSGKVMAKKIINRIKQLRIK